LLKLEPRYVKEAEEKNEELNIARLKVETFRELESFVMDSLARRGMPYREA
jgi:hypothetical protein